MATWKTRLEELTEGARRRRCRAMSSAKNCWTICACALQMAAEHGPGGRGRPRPVLSGLTLQLRALPRSQCRRWSRNPASASSHLELLAKPRPASRLMNADRRRRNHCCARRRPLITQPGAQARPPLRAARQAQAVDSGRDRAQGWPRIPRDAQPRSGAQAAHQRALRHRPCAPRAAASATRRWARSCRRRAGSSRTSSSASTPSCVSAQAIVERQKRLLHAWRAGDETAGAARDRR